MEIGRCHRPREALCCCDLNSHDAAAGVAVASHYTCLLHTERPTPPRLLEGSLYSS